MPIYEYTCKACGENFEELVSGTAKSVPCPKCASDDTERKMSAASVLGGGFGLSGLGPMPSGGGGCGGGGGFS